MAHISVGNAVAKGFKKLEEYSKNSDDESTKDNQDFHSQDKFCKSLKLDITEKQWFLSSSECQMNKLKDLQSADPLFINKKDFITGYTALHWAARDGKSELLHWLCDAGAKVNIRTNGGYTPLHLAVMHSQALIVDILITDYYADINARDYSGRKPGHYVQSDMPTWVQRALRANQGATEGPKIDALVMSSTASLAAMHGKPVARSWSSVKAESIEERANVDGVHKNRTKSILRSFKKIRHKDRQTPSREHHVPKNREADSKDRLKPETRSRSVPDICLTPRSKKKLLQIEHPHFDQASISTVKSCTNVSEADKSNFERTSSDLDEVISDEESDRTKESYTKPIKTELNGSHCLGDAKDEVEPLYPLKNTSMVNGVKTGSFNDGLVNGKDTVNKIGKDFKQNLIDKNANQWKATTLV